MKENIANFPPMGWNSWDCYGASVTEDEVRKNAEYMAQNLKEFGWEYIVVDIQWFEPKAVSNEYNKDAILVMDSAGRLLPAENRFPSASQGKGFLPLSQYVHSLGLKFGIHILRGIPKQAIRQNTCIIGSDKKAADIADFGSICDWNGDMCGIDMKRPGAQEYYDSILQLYATWEIDFIKVDDISRPYHKEEIESIQAAIMKTGREIVLSVSPGAAPVQEAEHLAQYTNMWRMTDDFWDSWELLRGMFDYCREWFPYVKKGHWPDCDMLPLGRIGIRSMGNGRMTNFTQEEQKTLLSLWCMFRSPLMFGGDMTMNDEFTLSLMQNKELLYINKHSYAGREVYRKGDAIVWACNGTNGKTYMAIFNIGEQVIKTSTSVSFLGICGKERAFELWSNQVVKLLGEDAIFSEVQPHGVKLYKIE